MKLVFTSKQVLEDKLPILHVVHDGDGDWQFLSGQEEGVQDGRIIALNELYAMDESLIELAGITIGAEARRSDADAAWLVYKSFD